MFLSGLILHFESFLRSEVEGRREGDRKDIRKSNDTCPTITRDLRAVNKSLQNFDATSVLLDISD